MSQLPDRALRAGRALLELGGTAAPGDIGRRAALDHNGQARALADLERAGLVERTKARVTLTSAGWDALLERPRPDAGVLDEALAPWPYHHRAFVELALSAIVARHHLGHLEPHLGFMAVGATGTGKTAMAEAICHLLGLDHVEHTLLVPQQTEGSVLGRRERTPDGWRFAPAPPMALPFVLFDEFDKGDEPVRRAVLPYFQGRLEVVHEGQRFRVAPTPMLAANPPQRERYSQLRSEYRRRSVVLDAGASRAAVAGLEEQLRAFYAEPRWRGLLRLDDLAPPASTLPEGLARFFGTLTNLLTDAGVDVFCDARALELATLGRAGLLGTDDLTAAAIATAHDYVACAETVSDVVRDGWHLEFAALREKVGPDVDLATLEAALARRHREAQQAATQARAARRAAASEDLELVRVRGELAAALRLAHDDLDGRRVPAEHRVPASGIRAQLAQLREPAGRAKTQARVEELHELAREPLAAAAALRRTIDDSKEAADAERRRQADDERRAREQAKASATYARQQQRSQAAALTAQLDTVRTIARPLEKLYARKSTKQDERPLAALARIRIDGHPILEYWPPAPEPPRQRKWYDALSRPAAPLGLWCSTVDESIRFAGTASQCAALEEWGPNTRAVLAPVLAALHAREDQVVAMLGRKPRPGRPAVGAGPAPARTVAVGPARAVGAGRR